MPVKREPIQERYPLKRSFRSTVYIYIITRFAGSVVLSSSTVSVSFAISSGVQLKIKKKDIVIDKKLLFIAINL